MGFVFMFYVFYLILIHMLRNIKWYTTFCVYLYRIVLHVSWFCSGDGILNYTIRKGKVMLTDNNYVTNFYVMYGHVYTLVKRIHATFTFNYMHGVLYITYVYEGTFPKR
jgi:hypothetical protein